MIGRLWAVVLPAPTLCIFMTTVPSPFTVPSAGSIYDPPIFVDDVNAGEEPVSAF